METSIKNKACICQYVKDKNNSFNCPQDDVAIETIEYCEEDKDVRLTLWNRRAFGEWLLCASDGNYYAFRSINYCPFCGRKLTEE
jgi:hypothetical protein